MNQPLDGDATIMRTTSLDQYGQFPVRLGSRARWHFSKYTLSWILRFKLFIVVATVN